MKTAKEEIVNLRHLKTSSVNSYNNEVGPNKESRYDKTGFYFSNEKHHHNLNDVIYFTHYSGVYGDSGVSRVFREAFAKYIVQALNKNMDAIFRQAIELIDEDIKSKVSSLLQEKEELEKMIKEIEDAPQNTKEAVQN